MGGEGIKTWREGKDGKGGNHTFFSPMTRYSDKILECSGKEHVLNTSVDCKRGP